MDIMENVFIERVVNPWKNLPRAMLESPPLEGFERYVDTVLKNMV